MVFVSLFGFSSVSDWTQYSPETLVIIHCMNYLLLSLHLWSKELAVTYLGYITPRSGGQHFLLTVADRLRSESEDESQNI